MKISKKELERLIREELQKEIEEGIFDAFKGGLKKIGGDVARGVTGAAKAAGEKASQAAGAVKKYGQDVKAAGQAASAEADKQKLLSKIDSAKQQAKQSFSSLLGQADALGMETEANDLQDLLYHFDEPSEKAPEAAASELALSQIAGLETGQPSAPESGTKPTRSVKAPSQRAVSKRLGLRNEAEMGGHAPIAQNDSDLMMKLMKLPRDQRIAVIDKIQKDHYQKHGEPKFRISALAMLGYYTREELDDMGYDPT